MPGDRVDEYANPGLEGRDRRELSLDTVGLGCRFLRRHPSAGASPGPISYRNRSAPHRVGFAYNSRQVTVLLTTFERALSLPVLVTADTAKYHVPLGRFCST